MQINVNKSSILYKIIPFSMKFIEFSISHFFEFIKKNVYFFLKNVQNCGMM